jgi:hypothetical protein
LGLKTKRMMAGINIVTAACSLLAARLQKKERVVLFGGGNKIAGLLLACCRSMEESREISSCG